MTATSETIGRAASPLPNAGWPLWIRQTFAVFRMEVKKNFLGRRALLIYLLAASPVLLMAALSVQLSPRDDVKIIFANLYEGMILRTIVFFGCAWIFMNLFRGEVVDKSLHYYFLCPLRREVLVAGKYLSGLVTSVVLFSLATAGSVFFLFLGLRSGVASAAQAPGM